MVLYKIHSYNIPTIMHSILIAFFIYNSILIHKIIILFVIYHLFLSNMLMLLKSFIYLIIANENYLN